MYLHRFNAVTDALRDLEQGSVNTAKLRLMEAQKETERIFCDWEENISEDAEIILDKRPGKC